MHYHRQFVYIICGFYVFMPKLKTFLTELLELIGYRI